MAKEDLIPVRSTQEAKERGRIGGINSGKTRRKKKQVKDLLQCLLSNKAESLNPKILSKIKKMFPDIETKTLEDVLNLSMIKEGVRGNVQAYKAVYDRIEGKPKQKNETDITTQGEKLVVYIPQEKND